MNKLERKQLHNKHTHKHFDGWTNFTSPRCVDSKPQRPVSYSTKARQRDDLKLEREGWK